MFQKSLSTLKFLTQQIYDVEICIMEPLSTMRIKGYKDAWDSLDSFKKEIHVRQCRHRYLISYHYKRSLEV